MSANSPSRLRWRALPELLAAPPATPKPLLAPWLHKGEAVLLFAPTGLGKSLLASSIALAVISGRSLLGWSAPECNRVLMLDGEMPEYIIAKRLGSLAHGLGVIAEETGDRLRIISRQGQPLDIQMPDLDESEGQEEVLQLALKAGADLIILDNLCTLATIGDENAAESFHGVNRFVMRAKQAGLAVLLVHHAGKGFRTGGAVTPRGSSNLETTFDFTIGLRPLVNGRRAQAAFEIVPGKSRNGVEIEAMDVRLVSNGEALRWESSSAESAAIIGVVEALRSRDYGSQEEIASALSISEGEVSKRLGRAEDQGLIKPGERGRILKEVRRAREIETAADVF